MTRPRSLSIAGVGLVMAMLSACGGGAAEPKTSSAPKKSEPAFATPKVGECWGPMTSALFDAHVDTRSTVPCKEPHGSETILVTDLSPEAAALTHEQAVALGHVSPEILPNFIKCEEEFKRYVGESRIGSDSTRPTNFNVSFYIPPAEDWAAGARWFRCDAVLEVFETLSERSRTESFRNALAGDPLPDAVRECYRDITPDNDFVVFVPCDQPHRVEALLEFRISDPNLGPLLGDEDAFIDYVVDNYSENCVDRSAAYLGLSADALLDREDISLEARLPNLDFWPADPRFHLVKCLAVAGQTTVGTLEGLGAKPLPVG